MKTVYTCFCTDVIHEGHLNVLNEAKKLGRVVVGCLSDKVLIRYNKFPTVSQEERIKLYRTLDGVDEVIVQNDIGNKFSPTTIVACVTSKLHKAKLPTHIELNSAYCSLKQDSILLLEQIRTIDKSRLKEKICSLPNDVLDKMNKALIISLQLA